MTFALERKSTALAIPKGGTLFRFSFARWGDPKGTHGSRSLGSAPALRFYQIVYGPVKAMGVPPPRLLRFLDHAVLEIAHIPLVG